jgi:hypothetical protein
MDNMRLGRTITNTWKFQEQMCILSSNLRYRFDFLIDVKRRLSHTGDAPERSDRSFLDGACAEPERVRDESGPTDRMATIKGRLF